MTVVVTGEHQEEKETREGESEIERDLGHAEAEIEHHSEKLEEHEDNITDLKADRAWLQNEVGRIYSMIEALPQVPKELLEDLTARVTSLEEKITHKTQELTELPEQIVEKPKESLSLLDRIL